MVARPRQHVYAEARIVLGDFGMQRLSLTPRQWLVLGHDVLTTALALIVTFAMRFEGDALTSRLDFLLTILPGFAIYAGIVYVIFGLYRAKWRFASLPDLPNIVRVSLILALSLLALDYVLVAPNVFGQFFFGKITLVLYFFLQMFFLAGSRVIYRYFRYTRTRNEAKSAGGNRTLIVGVAADAELLLRAIEAGAIRSMWPAGVLSPSPADRMQTIRGIPVLGSTDDLETVLAAFTERGQPIRRLVLAPSALVPDAKPERLLAQARRLGLPVNQIPSLEGAGNVVQLAPISIEDLLLRQSVQIDYQRLEAFVRGKSVIVTGGGGSIGSEICRRVAVFGAARLLIIENSEPALYAIQEALKTNNVKAAVEGRIGDIRDRGRMMTLFAEFKPDVVFHAAALKHVPILESDWDEGIKTNVFGSVNVADAAAEAGAAAMVMISTDKAIEPVSVLGATKRIAEMYCQAIDAAFMHQGNGSGRPMRIISVRFGNVLASNGSVVPKFKAQIEAGGPVTVTHPDMVRYFMTIREACDLVLTSASHALSPDRNDVSVYVLNMGQPVRIVELAENIIRLSGLEPGKDIEIAFTGMRPGERLNEILFAREESSTEIGIAGVVGAKPVHPSLEKMRNWLASLERAIAGGERAAIYRVLQEAAPDFRPEAR
jgi:O-antigen biosynthesis protein WbqV